MLCSLQAGRPPEVKHWHGNCVTMCGWLRPHSLAFRAPVANVKTGRVCQYRKGRVWNDLEPSPIDVLNLPAFATLVSRSFVFGGGVM